MPTETFATPPAQPRDPKPADMVRVTARAFLVRDLDHTLRCCAANLDWEPQGAVQDLRREGYRRAVMPFTVANSAALHVIQPKAWNTDAAHYLNNWGPGLYYIRIAVNDLKAKAEDLKARGTAFTWVPESEAVGGRSLIRIDPRGLRGQVFEFEEA